MILPSSFHLGWHSFVATTQAMKHNSGVKITALLAAFYTLAWGAFGQPVSIPPEATTPQWPKPSAPSLSPSPVSVRSQDLELIHSSDSLGGFVVRISGKDFAIGQSRPMIGYVINDHLRWFELSTATDKKVKVTTQGGSVGCHWEGTDPDAARWQLEYQFRPGSVSGGIDVQTQVSVDHDRQVAFLPMFMIFPGSGSFGAVKGQGLFAGLEYLENEPSSSEADVVGPASKRQVPDNLKITFPLMAIQNEDRFLALVWQIRPQFSAVYDSPDRLFRSGGHVMGIIFPGSSGKDRQEGNLLPRTAGLLSGGSSLVLRATLLGGLGKTIIPAVEEYLKLRGLPPLPSAPSLQQYASLATGGWFDSKIREGKLFHHAVAGGNFPTGPAADAAVWMNWLAGKAQGPSLANRLRQTADEVIAEVAPQDLYSSGVGHIRYPLAPLIYGHVRESTARAAETARASLARFEADGSLQYRARPGGPDYAKTHFSKEATGFTSRAVQDALEAGVFNGNPQLISAALKDLDALDKFRNGVPRGAQTWECPLHTPDILASAQMVRCYTLGYELTGKTQYLDQARYWAWTGVPFIYLVNPTAGAVGNYSTIAVFGATQWKAPIWMGLPVQWCGLVYADALYRLVRHDPKGPWKKIADGITVSGIQQSWPLENAELQGLLPDSFVLREQHRNGPAINPATVEACAVRYFSSKPAYDFRSFRGAGVQVHAPGEIKDPVETKDKLKFAVAPWVEGPYYVLINGLKHKPLLKIGGVKTDCSAPHEFLEKEGQLILKLGGSAQIEVGLQLGPY
jgi:hypothetical protein